MAVVALIAVVISGASIVLIALMDCVVVGDESVVLLVL